MGFTSGQCTKSAGATQIMVIMVINGLRLHPHALQSPLLQGEAFLEVWVVFSVGFLGEVLGAAGAVGAVGAPEAVGAVGAVGAAGAAGAAAQHPRLPAPPTETAGLSPARASSRISQPRGQMQTPAPGSSLFAIARLITVTSFFFPLPSLRCTDSPPRTALVSPQTGSLFQVTPITFTWSDITSTISDCVAQASSFVYQLSIWNSSSIQTTTPVFTISNPVSPLIFA